MGILVVGTVALDTVETPSGQVKDVLGGSASYFSLSASFFSKVKIVSVVGEDFPKEYCTFFQSRGIDTAGLKKERGKTFKWSGRYSDDLNNPQTLKTELNLLAGFNPQLPTEYRNEQYVFLANIDPTVQLEVLKQLKAPKLVVADTMNYWIEHKKEIVRQVVKKCDILLLNDSEAREFTQQSNLLKAGESLLALGPRLVIIKRGEYGCALFSRRFSFYIPAYLLEKVADPTGAGDTFGGGFLGYLASCGKITQSTMKKATVMGAIMASYAVEDFSLRRLSRLRKREIQARFKDFQRMTRF